MIIEYGGVRLDDHVAMPTFFGAARRFNSRGQAQSVVKRMVISGELLGTSATTIDAKVATLQSVFAVNGGLCRLLQTDGTATRFILGETGSFGGCKVLDGPTFTLEDGKAHYCTGLPFTVAMEAEYPVLGAQLVAFQETITRVGTGGPRRVTIELDNAFPAEQIVSQATPVVVVQTGEAIGFATYPVFPDPIFPTQVDLPDGYQTTVGSPRVDGGAYVDFPIRWNYRMTLPQTVTIPYPSTGTSVGSLLAR